MDSILLAKESLVEFPLLAIVELNSLVRGRGNAEFALVVKVQASDLCRGRCIVEGFRRPKLSNDIGYA